MKKDKLYIVIPAYNEEKNIKNVITSWYKIIKKIGNDSKLIIINDGSKDNTYKECIKLKKKYSHLIVIDKENEGHGATILYGYNYAIKNKADYIFQTDSDGQTIPEEFWEFWNERKKYDAIIGNRKKREEIIQKTMQSIVFLCAH